jgi:hypothetical protein
MNSVSFGKEIYGIRWGKFINNELHITVLQIVVTIGWNVKKKLY